MTLKVQLGHPGMGGIAGALSIKVDNMVPACCITAGHRGHALLQAPVVDEYGFERGDPPPRQREENE